VGVTGGKVVIVESSEQCKVYCYTGNTRRCLNVVWDIMGLMV
jgi:hypothetical protein